MSESSQSDAPTPREDATVPEGPGGVDAVPDWEAAGSDAVTPDPPRSAQVDAEQVPDGIEDPEAMDESDGAGSHPDHPEAHKDPAEDGRETLTEPAADDGADGSDDGAVEPTD